MPSPFPGMDPYLERSWRDVHARLVVYASDALNEVLPADLVSRMKERVYVETEAGEGRSVAPDVRVIERPARPVAAPRAATAVAEPVYLRAASEPVTERFIQILELDGGRVVTAIEFLSPANELPGPRQEEYLRKRDDDRRKRDEFLAGDANLVEIDLVRAGQWVTMLRPFGFPAAYRTTYRVSVHRAAAPDRSESYPVTLRLPLPAIPVPRRAGDADAVLSLQPLLDRAYAAGRYDSTDYRLPPDPPLGGEDAAWADELVRAAGRTA